MGLVEGIRTNNQPEAHSNPMQPKFYICYTLHYPSLLVRSRPLALLRYQTTACDGAAIIYIGCSFSGASLLALQGDWCLIVLAVFNRSIWLQEIQNLPATNPNKIPHLLLPLLRMLLVRSRPLALLRYQTTA